MKKILFLIILIIFSFIFSNNVYAITVGMTKKISEVVNDESGELYENVDGLVISQEESQYLDVVNFSRFNNLKHIIINDSYNLDLSKIIPPTKVVLSTNNSVLDFSKLDLSKFERIGPSFSFDISSESLDSSKIFFKGLINSEYQIDENYDNELNNVAKEIYSKSSNPLDIIENVTLYVINKVEYDYNSDYTGLPVGESIFEHNKCVCYHYAYLESQLLNKLGIFAIDMVGYATEYDMSINYAHSWVIIYFNDAWYAIDPTWIDRAGQIFDRIPEGDGNYMVKLSDINDYHYPSFKLYDKIPVKNRVSKMSIIQNDNSSLDDNTISSTTKELSELKNPNTGNMVIYILIISSISLLGVLSGFMYLKKRKLY